MKNAESTFTIGDKSDEMKLPAEAMVTLNLLNAEISSTSTPNLVPFTTP